MSVCDRWRIGKRHRVLKFAPGIIRIDVCVPYSIFLLLSSALFACMQHRETATGADCSPGEIHGNEWNQMRFRGIRKSGGEEGMVFLQAGGSAAAG